jgi:hypothetical protein
MARKKIPTALTHTNTWRVIGDRVCQVLQIARDSGELRLSAKELGVGYEQFIAAAICTMVQRELVQAFSDSVKAKKEKRSVRLVNRQSSTAQKPRTVANNRLKNRAVRGGTKPIPSKPLAD